jgi:hypothetical protein
MNAMTRDQEAIYDTRQLAGKSGARYCRIVTRPVGRPSYKPVVRYKSFL